MPVDEALDESLGFPPPRAIFGYREGNMPLVSVVIVLVVVGVILWLINSYIPMQGTIKNILNAVVVICVVVWLLRVFGVLGNVTNINIPKIN